MRNQERERERERDRERESETERERETERESKRDREINEWAMRTVEPNEIYKYYISFYGFKIYGM